MSNHVDCYVCGERYHDEDIDTYIKSVDTEDECFTVCRHHHASELTRCGIVPEEPNAKSAHPTYGHEKLTGMDT